MVVGGLEMHNVIVAALYRPVPRKAMDVTYREPKELQTLSETHETDAQEIDTTKVQIIGNGEETKQDHKNEDMNSRRGFYPIVQRYFGMVSNISFLLYGLEIICMSICIQSFFTYIPSHAKDHGTKDVLAALLISIYGAADTCGRFSFGFVFDFPSIRYRRRILHAFLLVTGGCISIITGFVGNYWLIIILCICSGLTMGGFHSQRATVVSEFVSPHQMATSVGFVLTFQSLGSLTGTPISGLLRDRFHSYSVSFWFSGSCAIFAGVLFLASQLLCKPCLAKCKKSQGPD